MGSPLQPRTPDALKLERADAIKTRFMKFRTQLQKEGPAVFFSPLPATRRAEVRAYAERMKREADLAKKNKEDAYGSRVAWEIWETMQDDHAEGLDVEYQKKFMAWMLGKGLDVDHKKTPWNREPHALELPEVRAWLDQIIDAASYTENFLLKLLFRGPQSLEDYAIYYKYLLHMEEYFLVEDQWIFIDFPKMVNGGRLDIDGNIRPPGDDDNVEGLGEFDAKRRTKRFEKIRKEAAAIRTEHIALESIEEWLPAGQDERRAYVAERKANLEALHAVAMDLGDLAQYEKEKTKLDAEQLQKRSDLEAKKAEIEGKLKAAELREQEKERLAKEEKRKTLIAKEAAERQVREEEKARREAKDKEKEQQRAEKLAKEKQREAEQKAEEAAREAKKAAAEQERRVREEKKKADEEAKENARRARKEEKQARIQQQRAEQQAREEARLTEERAREEARMAAEQERMKTEQEAWRLQQQAWQAQQQAWQAQQAEQLAQQRAAQQAENEANIRRGEEFLRMAEENQKKLVTIAERQLELTETITYNVVPDPILPHPLALGRERRRKAMYTGPDLSLITPTKTKIGQTRKKQAVAKIRTDVDEKSSDDAYHTAMHEQQLEQMGAKSQSSEESEEGFVPGDYETIRHAVQAQLMPELNQPPASVEPSTSEYRPSEVSESSGEATRRMEFEHTKAKPVGRKARPAKTRKPEPTKPKVTTSMVVVEPIVPAPVEISSDTAPEGERSESPRPKAAVKSQPKAKTQPQPPKTSTKTRRSKK